IDDSTFALRDFSRYFSDPNSPFDIPQTVFQTSYFSSFDVSMTLFNGALINGISIANANVDRTEHLSESTRENILFLVISSYLNVLKSQEILKLQQEYLELSRLNFEKAERMHNAGRYSKTEALRWKVDYQQQKSVVVNSESILRNDRSVLSRLLNMKPDAEIDLAAELPNSLLAESRKLALLPDEKILKIVQLSESELVRVNAALAAAKANTEVTRLLHRNEYASYLPNVSLNYSYAWRENNTLAFDDYSPKTFMINISIPIFTGFQNLTSVKSSYYEFKQSQEEFYDQLQNTRLLLTGTANRLINLKTQRELNKAEVEYNAHNYRVVEQQRERGLLSNIEFIDAKLNLQNAKLNEINAHYDFISAMVELYYLLGRLGAAVGE
ncbi:MAG: TolC family protein, partial [bacterium]